MSGFIDSEASEDSNLSEDEVVAKKRPKIQGSSSEDSEEDDIPNEDEICRKEGAGWLVDEEENSEQESEASKKDKHSDDDVDEDLDDEDFDLIKENVGINLKKQKKRRVILEDDDDDDYQMNRNNDKEKIAREIFETDDEDDDVQPNAKKSSQGYRKPQLDLSALVADEDEEEQQEYNEDDMGDFIVQDGDPGGAQVRTKKKQYIHQDAALQEAQDIFGVDFDPAELEKIGNYEVENDDQAEEEDYDSEEDAAERAMANRAKRIPKEVLEDNVHQMFDPSELERAYFSKRDEKIRKVDIPERFQLRKYPVKIIDEQPSQAEIEDITNEADFIFSQIFKNRPNLDKDHGAIKACIVRTLRILRDGSEVPFIALYRQESIDPHLKIDDLWKIYEYDERWCAIQQNKTSIIKVLQKLVNFFDCQIDVPEIAQDFSKKAAVEEKKQQVFKLIAQCRTCESLEEVEDVRQYYLLHLVEFSDSVKKWERSQNEENDGEADDINNARSSIENSLVTLSIDPVSGRTIKQRRARTTASYELAKRAKISDFVKGFGLSASQFAQNLNEQYVHHEVDQYPTLPLDAANDFVCPQFSTPEAVLKAARYMLALEISRELMVKKTVRQLMKERCIINIYPTKLGMREIDESHPLFKIKYIKVKPYEEFLNDPIYIQIDNGVKDGLITFELTQYIMAGVTLEDDLSRFFYKDEFSTLVQSWNEQRRMIIKESLDTFLIPQILKELKLKLLETSQQAVLELCSQRVKDLLSIAPYRVNSGEIDENDGDIYARRKRNSRYQNDSRRIWPLPSRVLAISIQEQDSNHLPLMTSVMLDSQGEIVDLLHTPNFLLFDKNNPSDEERNLRDTDKQGLSSFIQKYNPQVLVIGCDCRRSVRLQKHVQDLISDLQMSRKLSENCNIQVELVDTELANVFALSKTAASHLPSAYNSLTKKAISLGRRLQDPLLEFAQLMNYDQEILGLRLHPLQDFLPKEALYKSIEVQFVNRVNEVGVDINRALNHPHTANVVQFISGLGPRKSLHLLKTLKMKKMHLTNRMQLVTVCEFGPRVVVNCAGFIKIDTQNILAEIEDDEEVEILDSTRIHPECSDLAKKMAMDALEYEEEEGGNKSDSDRGNNSDDDDDLDSDDSGIRNRKKKNKKKHRKDKMEPDPTAALEEIIQSPGKLRDLDLDAFADELKRQGHGDKRLTLYAIRRELNQRYADFRKPYESPSQETIFTWVTKETPETLHIGSLVQGTLIQIVTKPPKSDQLDNANPQKIEETGRWMCPFCRQNDFLQLNNVWAHFDNNECPGRPVGLQVNLDNPTINGFVPLKSTDFRSDDRSSHDDEKKSDIYTHFPIGSLIQARVMKIDVARFSVELNSKDNVLKDERNVYRVSKDNYYDFEKEEQDQVKQKEEQLKEEAELAKKNQYFSRVIFHPNFKNISYDQLMAMESTVAVGDVIIRPSSKSTQNLTLSWKVDTGIFKHFNIQEEKKAVAYALGKKLILENEVYDDLDEIIARFVQPLSSLLNEIMGNKSYRDTKGGSKTMLDEMLRKDKSANPDRIPYFFTALASHPGYFLLGYMPNQRSHFEHLSITMDGFRFRKMIFPTLNRLLAWFKEHYNDPIMRNYHAANTPRA